jgi:hypothetical protein
MALPRAEFRELLVETMQIVDDGYIDGRVSKWVINGGR